VTGTSNPVGTNLLVMSAMRNVPLTNGLTGGVVSPLTTLLWGGIRVVPFISTWPASGLLTARSSSGPRPAFTTVAIKSRLDPGG